MERVDSAGRTAGPSARLGDLLILLLTATAAALVLHRSAYGASNLEIVPDAVEYAVVADRLAHGAGLGVVVDGKLLPSRYPPWFSLLLAPGCALSGAGAGGAIHVVTLFGVAGIVLAFLLGRRLGGPWGGAGAALSVLALPAYRFWGREIMTDVPSTALLIGAALAYVILRGKPLGGVRPFALAGGIVAAAALLRPLCGAAIVPFVFAALRGGAAGGWARSVGALLAFPALAVLATLGYDAFAFGEVTRNGYRFWCPVPYDYPSLVLSLSYVPRNVASLLDPWVSVPLVAAMGGAWLSSRRELRDVGRFLVLGVAPISAFHLVYFFEGGRFHLPLAAGCALVAGALAGRWLDRLPRAALAVVLAALVVFLGWVAAASADAPPQRRIAADRIVRATPADAWIVSAIDSAYLSHFAGTTRRYLPISRRVEYASKLIARTKIERPDPPPAFWGDHRAPGLLRGGAEEAVERVAVESVDLLRSELGRGRRVFLDTATMDTSYASDVEPFARRFRLAAVEPPLYELLLDGGTP